MSTSSHRIGFPRNEQYSPLAPLQPSTGFPYNGQAHNQTSVDFRVSNRQRANLKPNQTDFWSQTSHSSRMTHPTVITRNGRSSTDSSTPTCPRAHSPLAKSPFSFKLEKPLNMAASSSPLGVTRIHLPPQGANEITSSRNSRNWLQSPSQASRNCTATTQQANIEETSSQESPYRTLPFTDQTVGVSLAPSPNLSTLLSRHRPVTRLHSLLKYLAGTWPSTRRQRDNCKKKSTPWKSPKYTEAKKQTERLLDDKLNLEFEPPQTSRRQPPDRLERIMRNFTLITALLIATLLLVLVVCKISAQRDADSKRHLLQQQVIAPSRRLDLSKYEHLKQRKGQQVKEVAPPAERLEESLAKTKNTETRRLLIASSSTSPLGGFPIDALRAGLDGRVVTSGEREWEPREGGSEHNIPEVTAKPRRVFSSSKPETVKPEVGEPEIVPKVSPPLGDPCSGCLSENYLAHYYRKGCTPFFSRECNCAKYFRCPRIRETPSGGKVPEKVPISGGCTLDDSRYAYHERVPLPTEPCRICRCRKRSLFNGTVSVTSGEIDCSPLVECPEMVFGVRPRKATCHWAYSHESCCGREVCTDELPPGDVQVRTTCRYSGKVFKYGEIIRPTENSCLKCICDESWNEHDPTGSRSCIQKQCTGFLKENLLNKCTPVYRDDGCCPIDFICPPKANELYGASSSAMPEVPKKAETEEQTTIPTSCSLNGKQYGLTSHTYLDRKETQYGRVCAKCTCLVPPLLTCKADFRCNGQ